MTLASAPPYNKGVIRNRVQRWSTAAAVFSALVLLGLGCGAAMADTAVYPVGSSPILNINIEGASVAIKTWDRQAVQIESTTPVKVKQFDGQAVARALPKELPVFAGSIQGPHGQVTLPEETFPISSLGTATHDALQINGAGGTATITIPQSAALVVARMGQGNVTIDGYQNGTFFVRLRKGWVHLQNMSGEGFVQVMRGPIFTNDSDFSRLRMRTASGPMLFERCRVHQIEASSIEGSIFYDNGSFQSGLARLESQYGHVALGIGSGNAQVGAHSNSGHILTNFDRRANVAVGPNDATASLGTDGPTVTVSSGGAVLLYDGSIATRGNLGAGWRQVHALFTNVQNHTSTLQQQRSLQINRAGQGPRPPPHHRPRA